eukprot:g5603.t1
MAEQSEMPLFSTLDEQISYGPLYWVFNYCCAHNHFGSVNEFVKLIGLDKDEMRNRMDREVQVACGRLLFTAFCQNIQQLSDDKPEEFATLEMHYSEFLSAEGFTTGCPQTDLQIHVFGHLIKQQTCLTWLRQQVPNIEEFEKSVGDCFRLKNGPTFSKLKGKAKELVGYSYKHKRSEVLDILTSSPDQSVSAVLARASHVLQSKSLDSFKLEVIEGLGKLQKRLFGEPFLSRFGKKVQICPKLFLEVLDNSGKKKSSENVLGASRSSIAKRTRSKSSSSGISGSSTTMDNGFSLSVLKSMGGSFGLSQPEEKEVEPSEDDVLSHDDSAGTEVAQETMRDNTNGLQDVEAEKKKRKGKGTDCEEEKESEDKKNANDEDSKEMDIDADIDCNDSIGDDVVHRESEEMSKSKSELKAKEKKNENVEKDCSNDAETETYKNEKKAIISAEAKDVISGIRKGRKQLSKSGGDDPLDEAVASSEAAVVSSMMKVIDAAKKTRKRKTVEKVRDEEEKEVEGKVQVEWSDSDTEFQEEEKTERRKSSPVKTSSTSTASTSSSLKEKEKKKRTIEKKKTKMDPEETESDSASDHDSDFMESLSSRGRGRRVRRKMKKIVAKKTKRKLDSSEEDDDEAKENGKRSRRRQKRRRKATLQKSDRLNRGSDSESYKKISKRRVKWTNTEVTNLIKAVEKHGKGNWSSILADPNFDFNDIRTNVNLKDKWRNLENSGQV